MIITKKHVSRRAVLRGAGVTLALPLLDAMVPASVALANTAAAPRKRFGAVYVPNGIVMENWTPRADGAQWETTAILKPLEPFRERMLVVSGLDSRDLPGERPSAHLRGSTKFLTNAAPKAATGADLAAGTSIDQVLAAKFGAETQFASLELGLESTESAGSCEVGFSCLYTSTISWRTPTTPLPVENNPRAVFERLFGDAASTDAATRRRGMRQQRSVLDAVLGNIERFQGGLGPSDRAKLSEYLESVRDVERRIQVAEAQSDHELPVVERPVGIPASFQEHARLMYALHLLAYQTDLTRIITFMVGRELTGRQYPEIGVHDAHHPLSHHGGDPEKLARLAKINAFHTLLFAEYLETLRATPDGDSSLLDQTTIVYGSGLSDSDSHSPLNLPILLFGARWAGVRSGRHVRHPAGTPLANLNLALLHGFGADQPSHGDSTGPLQLG